MIARGPMTDNNSRSTAMGLRYGVSVVEELEMMYTELTPMSCRWLCDGEGGADDRGEDEGGDDEGGDDDVSHGEKVRNGDRMT